MRGFDGSVAKRLRERIAEAEGRSMLEIVVRVAPRSGSYADLPWPVAALLGVAALAFAVYS